VEMAVYKVARGHARLVVSRYLLLAQSGHPHKSELIIIRQQMPVANFNSGYTQF
jgi:hypothetical protein